VGIERIKGKIDTGARTSDLHAVECEQVLDEGVVRSAFASFRSGARPCVRVSSWTRRGLSSGRNVMQNILSITLEKLADPSNELFLHVVFPVDEDRRKPFVADPETVGHLMFEEKIFTHHHLPHGAWIDSCHVA
jgi:hypothetical protein